MCGPRTGTSCLGGLLVLGPHVRETIFTGGGGGGGGGDMQHCYAKETCTTHSALFFPIRVLLLDDPC